MPQPILADAPSARTAAIINQYGAPANFTISSLPLPQLQPNQLLLKNYASSINPIDWKLRRGDLKLIVPLKMPAILGFDYCGEVVATSATNNNFKVGDWVYGMSDQKGGGSYANYIAVGAQTAALLPKELTPTEAATIPLAGLTAWQSLINLGQLKANDHVLINGATGGVGLFAVQIALAKGAQVTVLASPANHALLKNLGVQNCFDYHTYDFTQAPNNLYDIIFDTSGKVATTDALLQLTPTGIFVTTLPHVNLACAFLKTLFNQQKVRMVLAKPNGTDLVELSTLIQNKQLKPHVQQVFALADIAAAHTLSEQGHTVGKIALKIL